MILFEKNYRKILYIIWGKLNIDNTSEIKKISNLLKKSGNIQLWGKMGNDLTDFYGNFV